MELLNKVYNTKNAELFVLYGRRRVGKTELLKEFIKDKRHIYFMADLNSEKALLNAFSERVLSALSVEIGSEDVSFKSWDAVFKFVAAAVSAEKTVVVLDEFQYICSTNQAFPSMIQRLWDELLQNSNIMLILCGSYISFMENEVLAVKSPLYGRRTSQFLLQPMDFFSIKDFFPHYRIDQLIEAYAILGGIPAYLKKFDDRLDLFENMKVNILSPETYLHQEIKFLLMQELREAKNYFSILQQIADGQTKLNDIVYKTGLDKGLVSKYICTLQKLRIVEREVPVTEKDKLKSKRGLYKIRDHFTNFWFRFVFPNEGLIEELTADYVLQNKVKDEFSSFVSFTFERICIEYLKRKNLKKELPFVFEKIGRWWEAAAEIDLLALGKNSMLAGECKWQEKKLMGLDIYQALVEKCHKIKETQANEKYYVLFSKAGFKSELKEEASREKNILLFDLEDLGKEL
jgi:AAA+ ATPase superfamily predicted ATPase